MELSTTVRILQQHEIDRLLEQPNTRYPTGQRNRLLIETIVTTGMRLSEVIGLKWKDVSLEDKTITIDRQDEDEIRVLALDESVVESLMLWRQSQLSRVEKAELVFTTLNGGSLKPQYVRDMIMRYANKAGIDYNVNPSILRHTFAYYYYRQTEDIERVQKALGHQHLQSTVIYKELAELL